MKRQARRKTSPRFPLSNRRIARALSITEGTVKVHVKHLLKKLSFRSRVEAAVWMAQQPH